LIRIESGSEKDTHTVGVRLGQAAPPGSFIALYGDLGAGKSVLARGVARGLGVERAVQSPTFTLLNVYEEGRLPLYHFDVYRLESGEELEALGYEESFYGPGVTVMEWPQRAEYLLPAHRLDVLIEAGDGPEQRVLRLTPHGAAAERMAREVCP
jgi:tRNA threonylcarbamoyladenosine biosynthesis protein TsaE